MNSAGLQADVFGAISAEPRRMMLQMLARQEMPVMQLADAFDMTLSAVSQHLTVLRQANLVTQRKDGRQRLYKTNAEPLKAVADWVQFYEPFWNERLANLGLYLEEQP